MPEKPPVAALLEMITGGSMAGAIATAAELGVPDQLSAGPKSAAELASAVHADESSLYRLLRYLASIGILREHEGRRFELTALGQLLRSDSPQSMRDAAVFFVSHHAQRPWEQAAYSVRTGKPSFDRMYGATAWDWYARNPDDAAVFHRAMSALSGSLHRAAVEAYDFSGITTIADIGGGHGHLLSLILSKHPAMRGILFDQPHVIKDAAPVFEKFRVAERARAIGGSFFENIPAEADAHILAHILHDWDDTHCEKILKNCRRSIASPGRLLVLDAVLKGTNEPDFGKLLDLEMLLVPSGRERTADEFESLFRACGWKLARILPTAAGKSVLEALPV